MALALGVSNNSGKASTPPLPPASGKTDLLLRFFDSQFFDEWIALTYLYKSNSPGVQDYLCNRLYSLPEDGVERYLSQLCQLLISRPYVSLERVLIDLCARSLRIAVKVYWLLLAISQDHPKNKYVADLRDKCERAALEGYWEPPFRDPKLLPLSPRGAIYSPPTSPTYCGNGRGMLSPSYHDRRMRPNNFDRFASPNARWGSPEPFTPPNAHRWASPDGTSRPTSPDGLGGGIFSSYTMGQGLEGLICASPSTVRLSRHSQSGSRGELSNGDTPAGHSDRVSKLRKELGEGEGVTALLEKSRRASEGVLQTSDEPEIMSPPSSPRLRQTTFGATLDFIEALCDASAGLTAFAQEDRQYALRRGLEEINKEIELASRHGVACWFPLGCRNERIVRLTAKEAVLLNSREKAPFILHIEVLRADAEEDEEGSAAPVREVPSDSARSLLGESAMGARLDSNAEAGPGPGSKAQQLSQPARLQHRRSDSAGEAEGHSRLPAGSASRGRVLGTRRSLSFPEAVSSAELDKLVFAMDMGSGQAGGSTGDPATKPALDYIADASAVVTAIQPGVTRSLHGSVSLPSYVADLKLMAGELQQLKVDDGAAAVLPASSIISPFAHQHSRPPGLSSNPRPHIAATSSNTNSSPTPKPTPSQQPAAPPAATQPRPAPQPTVSQVKPPSRAAGQPAGKAPEAVPPQASHQSARRLGVDLLSDSAGEAARQVMAVPPALEDSFSRGLKTALAGLRGEGPLVTVRLQVLNDYPLAARHASAPGPLPPVTPSADEGGGRSDRRRSSLDSPQSPGRVGVTRVTTVTTAAESMLQSRGFGLLLKWGLCRRVGDDSTAGRGQAEPRVRLHLKVAGGVDLRLGPQRGSGSPKHRRVPSHEALMRMAAQHNSPVPAFPSAAAQPWQPSEELPAMPVALPDELALVGLGGGRSGRAMASAAAGPSSDGQSRWPGRPAQQARRSEESPKAPSSPSHRRQPLRERNNNNAAAASRLSFATTVAGPAPPPGSLDADTVMAEASAAGGLAGLRSTDQPEGSHGSQSQGQDVDLAVREGSLPLNRSHSSRDSSRRNSRDHSSETVALSKLPIGNGLPPRGIDAARLASHATASTSAAAPPYTGIADAARVVREEREARRLQAQARAVFGERFQHKAARIKKESPHGRRPGWAVRSVIVKSGDDCRQELLAMQLIRTFHDIFQDAQLPLWLHPYEVLVTSNRTALIEMVPDSLSIHSVKAKSPPGMSLRNFFLAKFGKDTPELMAAQRNFAESMAGYSLVCYLLQIKDRHNGNILLDDAGHIIHIDFGFMLSNSPGGVNFEAAPFKLTRELLEVLNSNSEGKQSDLFDYYKVMCIQGFLACRKHADRVILLVEMMAGSGCPCFKAGARAVQNLRKRFHLGLTEAQCVEVVLGMISDSLDAWRTRQYDYYQRVLNGIL